MSDWGNAENVHFFGFATNGNMHEASRHFKVDPIGPKKLFV